MSKHSPLHNQHLALKANLIEFAGYLMPLHYGSQLQEHLAVRNAVGMFDVSHMMITDISGPEAKSFLQILIANDVAKLSALEALYGVMLTQDGGILDDLIVYYLGDDKYRLITNAGTREKITAWLHQHVQHFQVILKERQDLAMIAVQGPNTFATLSTIFQKPLFDKIAALKPFSGYLDQDIVIARTGYTGEDGVEIILPVAAAQKYWQLFLEAGIKPCGLGSRDTLRLEAGLNLYSVDMNEQNDPYDSNLAWTVAWEPSSRNFIGREALSVRRKNNTKQLTGLILEDRGIPRAHQAVYANDQKIGEITSGTFSPSLQRGIAFARLQKPIPAQVRIKIRDKFIPAKVVKPPIKKRKTALV